MSLPLSKTLSYCLLGLFAVSSLIAREAPVEVERVNFNSINAGNRGNWQEIEIQLDVRRSADPEAPNPAFASDIQVVLHAAYEASGRGDDLPFIFFSSEVEIAALERGTRQNQVLFYLPPEIVKREGINAGRAPFRFIIELRADGQEIPFSRESQRRMSRELMDPEAVSSFMSQVRSHAAANEGDLMPIFKTPFWHSRRAENSPPYRW